jgi:hypothetical protein
MPAARCRFAFFFLVSHWEFALGCCTYFVVPSWDFLAGRTKEILLPAKVLCDPTLDLLHEVFVDTFSIATLAATLATPVGIVDAHTTLLRRLPSAHTAPRKTLKRAQDVAGKAAIALRKHELDDIKHREAGLDAFGCARVVESPHKLRTCADEIVEAGYTIRTVVGAAEVEVRKGETLQPSSSREHSERALGGAEQSSSVVLVAAHRYTNVAKMLLHVADLVKE